MKIIVDKYEYANIIRRCAKSTGTYTPCQGCALVDICGERETLENSVEIAEQEA